MRYLTRAPGVWWTAAALLLTLMLVLAGCRASGSGPGAPRGQATEPAAATATATSAPAYATPLATAVPTTGWAIYHDAHYPFQLPIPPGWQTGTVSWPAQGAGSCAYYEVGIFPPGVKPDLVEPLAETNDELIKVSVSLTCAPGVFDSGQRWIAEASPVIVSGTTTTIYDRTDPADGPVLSWDCAASSIFGGLPYSFYEQSPPSTAARDISVFRAILGGFKYTGK